MNDTIFRRSVLMVFFCLNLTGCWFGQSTGTIHIEPRPTFIERVDGAIVTSPFKVRFGVVGAELRPAGDFTPGAGHHHLIIDRGAYSDGEGIPFGVENVTHYGDASAETMVALPEGEHTLIAQLGNGSHKVFGIPATIHVTVVPVLPR